MPFKSIIPEHPLQKELPKSHYTCSCGVKFSVKPPKGLSYDVPEVICPSCKKKDVRKTMTDKIADVYEIAKLDIIKR